MQPYGKSDMASFTSKDGLTPFKLLLDLGLLDWSSVYLGMNLGWVNRENARDFASLQLAKGSKAEGAALIVDNENISFDDLIVLVFKQIKRPGVVANYDIWRFALLLYIRESDDDVVKKLVQVHRVYVQFNYPEDMLICTGHDERGIAPLEALNHLVEELQLRFSRTSAKLKH